MAENITLEQKEKNRQYILTNLDKYTIDANGDFFNADPTILGEEYDYISKNTLTWKATDEIKKKMTEMIVKNIKDWELILFDHNDDPYPNFFKNKKTSLIIEKGRLGYWNEYWIVGEFGYRGSKWKDYEKWKQDREKQKQDWWNNNQTTSPPPTNPTPEPYQTTENQKSENPKKQSEQEPQTNNSPTENPNSPKTENQNAPTNPNNNPEQPHQSPTPPNNNETSNPLPTPETIQNHYNQDKDRSLVENNSTDEEQKQANQELLNLIITAELLIKDNQFNPDTLSQLLKEKEQNTEAYQLLKERIEQVINELSSLQQSQNKNNESVANNNKSDISPIKIFTIIGIIGVIIMASLVVFKKAKKRKKG
ncbi:MAG: hypothetical protein MRERV_23c002 [Mycoplasmataceae bacterium RV_VA103A]|nr:MAG: hypothetical protein MRERV_23c002 [Mycoplasmataceae bacterium RV_VA103A]